MQININKAAIAMLIMMIIYESRAEGNDYLLAIS